MLIQVPAFNLVELLTISSLCMPGSRRTYSGSNLNKQQRNARTSQTIMVNGSIKSIKIDRIYMRQTCRVPVGPNSKSKGYSDA